MRKISGFLAVLLFALTCAAQTYYVDSTAGNNANDGRGPESAWQTLAKATTYFQTAELGSGRILLRRSRTFTDSLELTDENAGSTTPFTIGAYGAGAKPIIDLNLRNTSTSFGIHLNRCGAAIIEDIEIRRVYRGVYYRNSNSGADWRAGGIHLRRLTITDIGYDCVRAGDNMKSAADGAVFLIESLNCSETSNDGISFGFSSTLGSFGIGFEVRDCDLTNIGLTSPIDANSGDAITAHDNADGFNFWGNRINGCVDGIHCINTKTTAYNHVSRNWIKGARGSGVRWDFGGQVNLWNVWGNVIEIPNHANAVSGVRFGDSLIVPAAGDAWALNLFNNVIVNNKSGAYCLYVRTLNFATPACNLQAWNNIFVTVSGGLAIHHDNPAASGGGFNLIDMGKNIYYSAGSLATGFNWDGATGDFAAWKTASGTDSTSTEGTNPGLLGDVTVTPANAAVVANSIAIGTGRNLDGVGIDFGPAEFGVDFNGALRPKSGPWDRGAIQYALRTKYIGAAKNTSFNRQVALTADTVSTVYFVMPVKRLELTYSGVSTNSELRITTDGVDAPTTAWDAEEEGIVRVLSATGNFALEPTTVVFDAATSSVSFLSDETATLYVTAYTY